MRTKKLFVSLTALLLAVSMLLSMGVGAFAAVPEETAATQVNAKPDTKAAVDATPEGLYFGFGNTEADAERYATSATKLVTQKEQISTNEIASNHYITTGSNPSDDQFSVTLDAYSYSDSIYATPLDVSIILDRSGSMAAPADPYDVIKITSVSQLDSVLKTLDTTKYAGYYRASAWLRRSSLSGPTYPDDTTHPNQGYCSWETLKYENGNWYMWVPILPNSLLGGRDLQFGICVTDSTKMYGEWQEIHTAYNTYISRRTTAANKNGFTATKYPFQITVPRLTFAINSIESFLSSLNKTTANLRPGEHHTVSILGYAGSVFADGFVYRYWEAGKVYRTYNVTTTDVSIGCTRLDTNYDKLVSTLRGSYLHGNTLTSWPMKVVAGTVTNSDVFVQKSYDVSKFNYLAPKTEGRKRVVILLTDGVPTGEYGVSVFNAATANEAITAAAALKKDGVEVYTIGFMPGMDENKPALNYDGTEEQDANSFLQLVSSNYPEASSMTEHGASGMASNQYYLTDDGSGNCLIANFERILSAYAPSADSLPEKPLAIYEEFTPEFKPDWAQYAKVYVSPYQGNGIFGDRILIGQHALTELRTQTQTGLGYTLSYDAEMNSIKLLWTDASFGQLREMDVENAKACYPWFTKGYKIFVELPIAVDRNATIGGNNIPVNYAESGLYHADASGQLMEQTPAIVNYEILNVNVPFYAEHVVHDYFMSMQTLMDLLENNDDNAAMNVFQNLFSIDHMLSNGMGGSRIDRIDSVNITMTDSWGNKLYFLSMSAWTEYVEEWCVPKHDFNFLLDQSITVTMELNPNSNSYFDSVNNEPYCNYVYSESAYYYAPKFAVIDYGCEISVPMQMEGDDSRFVYTEDVDGGAYIDGCISYGDQDGGRKWQNLNYRSFSYTFEAIHPRKGASLVDGKDIVSREMLLFPASVMTYDDTFLFGSQSPNWCRVGEYVQGEQVFDNTLRHGFDPNLSTAYGDLHGSSLVALASADSSDSPLVFQFWGTGFEVLSRTAPSCGAMFVEVRHLIEYDEQSQTTIDHTSGEYPTGTLVKLFLVDNYREYETLYQVPVVQCDDLPFGAYRVNIYPCYNKYFDSHCELTEETVRELFIIDEAVDFTFLPSPSARKETEPHGSREVYVDGIRYYNTRGDLSFMDTVNAYHRIQNKLFRFVYSLAGEAAETNYINLGEALFRPTCTDFSWYFSPAGALYACENSFVNHDPNFSYYHSAQETLGSKNEIYFTSQRDGLAFRVHASDNMPNTVQLSVRSVYGDPVCFEAYCNSKWVKVVDGYTSMTEGYFEVPVVDGVVMLRHTGGTAAISTLKGAESISCDLELLEAMLLHFPVIETYYDFVPESHRIVVDEAISPTCVEVGYTEGSHCADCGMIIQPQEVIPVIDHSYEGEYHICECGAIEQITVEFVVEGMYMTDWTMTCDYGTLAELPFDYMPYNAIFRGYALYEGGDIVCAPGEYYCFEENVTLYAVLQYYSNVNVTESISVGGYIGEGYYRIAEDEPQIIHLDLADPYGYVEINSITVSGHPISEGSDYLIEYGSDGVYVEFFLPLFADEIEIDLTAYTLISVRFNGGRLTEMGREYFSAYPFYESDSSMDFYMPYGTELGIYAPEDLFVREGYSLTGALYDDNGATVDFMGAPESQFITLQWSIEWYTVTWIVDGEPIYDPYEYGAMPKFYGSTEKKPDGCTYYTFIGWDYEPTEVTEDVTYTALYEEYIWHCEATVVGTAPTCTETGLTEGTQCGTCGEFIVPQEVIPALGHSYTYTDNGNKTHTVTCENCDYNEIADCTFENGECICGAKEVIEPIYDDAVKFSHSLTLENDISINFIGLGSALSVYDSFYLECKVPVYNGNELVGYKTVNIEPVFNGKNYECTLLGVTAKMMNDEIEAVFHMTKDGQEYYSKTDVYSVAEYAYGKLDSTKTGDTAELKAICANLLRYGSMAQTHFGYRTDALVDAAMTDAHKAYLTDLSTVEMKDYRKQYSDLDTVIVPWKSTTLELGNKVIMCLIANLANYSGDPAELTMRLTYTNTKGVTVTEERPLALYNPEALTYAVSYDGLRATEMRTIVSAAIYRNGERVSKTVEYSIESYGARSTDSAMQYLCRAMLAYGDSAKIFFAN